MQKRPWEISDLLALRDGELRDAGSAVDDPAALQQLNNIRQLQSELNNLPDVPVDEAIWNRPLSSHKENHKENHKETRSAWLRFPLATAASVFFASVVGIYLTFNGFDPDEGALPNGQEFAGSGLDRGVRIDRGGVQLAALMNQSRELERRLQGVNPWTLSQANSQVDTAPGIRPVSTTERRLMGRLVDVDAQIASLYEAQSMDARARQALWAQRVNLLESLVAVRGGIDPRLFEDSRSM